MNKLFKILVIFLITSCAANQKSDDNSLPSWYISPTQNDSSNLYGVAEGHSLEEATRLALGDAASRLIVSISASSTLIREENQNSTNEEMRQRVTQNIEKIDFSNFNVSQSKNIGPKFYVEVEITRRPFVRQQKDQIKFLERKINDLDENSQLKNPLQRRNDFEKAFKLAQELELRSRVATGAGANINLNEKLTRVADIENKLNQNLDKIEFFFEFSSPPQISNIIRRALNREKIAVAKKRNLASKNQILIKISAQTKVVRIYGSIITKIAIDFDNSIASKSLASAESEVNGSSVISPEESYSAALKSLEEKIAKEGILKTIGILN